MVRRGEEDSVDAAGDRRGHDPAVLLDGVAVSRGGRRLWGGVDLRVDDAQFVAVLGPNGVGKSTMLALLLGLQPAAEGTVRVLGERAGRANTQIGYLPQRRTFDPSLRIRGRDVVRLGLDGTRWGFPIPGLGRWSRRSRAAVARVDEVLELVGATGYADRPVGQCSGGEQQRLLIAQALVSRPRLLLLDEPLDSLDLPNQNAVAALINRVSREQGIAVVMVAHDVNPVLEHLDTVVYLAPGGCEVGAPQQVITSGTLSRLFATPIDVLTASDGRTVVVGQPAPAPHAPPASEPAVVGASRGRRGTGTKP